MRKTRTTSGESPALDILKLLHERGREIFYHDPLCRLLPFNGYVLQSIPLSPETLSASDVAVVVTDHSLLRFPSRHREPAD